jgi:hypothetical protein
VEQQVSSREISQLVQVVEVEAATVEDNGPSRVCDGKAFADFRLGAAYYETQQN